MTEMVQERVSAYSSRMGRIRGGKLQAPWIRVLRDAFYWSTLLLFKFLGKIYTRAEVYNQERLPTTGACIAVLNHQSHVDAVASAMTVRRRVHVMVKDTLFKIPLFGWWMRIVYMFPVRRGALDRKAFEHSIQVLRNGDALFMAPEGTRRKSWTEPPPKARTGFVRMAQLTACPVVPIAIWGTDRVLPAHSIFPRPRKVRVMVGEPIRLPKIEVGARNRDQLQEQADFVMSKVYELWEKLDAMDLKRRR